LLSYRTDQQTNKHTVTKHDLDGGTNSDDKDQQI